MNGFPVETLKLLNETSAKAAGVDNQLKIIKPPAEPDHVYLIARTVYTEVDDQVSETVEFTRVEGVPGPRDGVIGSVGSIPAAIERLRAAEVSKQAAPIVWYGDYGISVEIDRRQSLGYVWNPSSEYKSLLRLPAKFDPRSLRKWLRVEMAGRWSTNAQQLHDVLGSLKFNVNSETRTTVTRARESLGRDLDAKVSAEAGELPEWIELKIPLVRDPSIINPFTIRLDVDVDAANGVIELTPFPDSLHNAMEALIGDVVQGLRNQIPAEGEILCGQWNPAE